MYNERLLDHFKNPRNVGQLNPPAITVEVTNPACGDILRLGALLEGDHVVEVAYQVRGCTASIAAGSALTLIMEGKSLAELILLKPSDVESAVGGLAPESKHAAYLCIDAVRALVKTFGR
jgi:nitrogen fixation NifU-like protein